MKLTEKQKRFCDYYIASGNATESYKKAYSTCKKEETAWTNASRLLSNAKVKAYIEERNKELNKNSIATIEEVQAFWTRIIRGEEVDAEMKDRLKASELIGKAKGIFIEKREINGNMNIRPKVKLSDKQVEEEMKRLEDE